MCVWYTIEPESDVWQHCQSHKLAEHSWRLEFKVMLM